MTGMPSTGAHLLRIAILTSAAAYAYVLSEWLFFVTKPSVLSALSALEKLEVLLIAPLAPLVAAVLALLLLAPAGLGLCGLGARVPGELLAGAAPAALLTATEILLIDNFTHTVLGFHVGSYHGPGRYLYGLGFVVLFGWTTWSVSRWARSPRWTRRTRPAAWATGAVTATSLIALVLAAAPAPELGSPLVTGGTARLPNIVILVGDGIESRRMSALGFGRRDTTPFIRSLLPDSLVFKNHFTNAANTTGSVGSLLTGRLPTQTRVVFPPDVFRGADAYLHLPAILRGLGYHSADISVRHYADAYDLNLRNGFQYANSRSLERPRVLRAALFAHPSTSLFLEESYGRVTGRLWHAFGLADLVDPYAVVTQMRRTRLWDSQRIAELLAFLDRAPEPFFAHLHLMGTHGPYFYPRTRLFSKGKRQGKSRTNAFYDDALRDYDAAVAQVVDHLRRSGSYDRTLLVLNSDHGRHHATRENLPLIIKPPRGGRTGRVWFNTQRVDIAPTILDYLGVEKPEWMAGDSLLSGELDRLRPLVQSRRAPSVAGRTGRVVAWSRPPFYSLGVVGVVYCQWWYRLNLARAAFSTGVVGSHTAHCNRSQRPPDGEARSFLIDHLRENGYDVGSLSSDRSAISR